MNNKEIIKNLINYPQEESWFEFKENWFDLDGIGEYISALSNSATFENVDCAYLVWGVNDKTHEIVGTNINYKKDVNNEPVEHYLTRCLSPDIYFKFEDVEYEGKRLVLLTIPKANKTPTSFKKIRYIRIGSSKVVLEKHLDRESHLFDILRNGFLTIENQESDYQNLTFSKLMIYYASRGIDLNPKTFEDNLGLLTKDVKYNKMAQLLSDNSHITARVSIFIGEKKSDPLYSVKEFDFDCLLVTVDKILTYGEAINIPQADERNRVVERKEINLFDIGAYREAIINAFLHNDWLNDSAPMITVYSDRIEIMSWGKIPPKQTMEGFFMGKSVPVNKALSDIFLQLHISERSGRGVPKIVGVYGRDAYTFDENTITVTIPFTRINKPSFGFVLDKTVSLNNTQSLILTEIRNNPNIKSDRIMELVGIKKTALYKNMSFLKKNGYIERVGSDKKGYWKVLHRE